MIKLLTLDLDGTLLDSSGLISDANRNAIREAESRGVLVTIATGRRFRDAEPVGIDLELNAPLITHNGALLKYAGSGGTVAYSVLPAATCQEILLVGQAFGGDALVSTDPHGKGSLFYDRVSENNAPLKKYLQWAETLHGREAARSVRHVSDLRPIFDQELVIHISFSGTCSAMSSMHDVLKHELGDTVTILTTVYPRQDFTLIDILPPDSSKGVGVEKLACIEGLNRNEVMSVGDNFNDIEMLEFAGTAVVMGNADPRLLERREFYTTVSNDENGVAEAIKQFILNQEK
jgi:Cof subfamily protein (haloacid dehalogenase superfamily)